MFRATLLALFLVAAVAPLMQNAGSAAQESTPVDPAKQLRGPLVYRSPESGVLVYVESDRRHVSAIDPKGKILWCRDPFVDAGLTPYRVKAPIIARLGAPHEWMIQTMERRGKMGEWIGISFTSSQFGVLDAASGDFTFLGQD
jgi:hypothetical protein